MTSERPPELLDRLRTELLSEQQYTRVQVAEQADVPLERAEKLWRALGFVSVSDDDVVFGDKDVQALRTIVAIVDAGVVSASGETSVARSLGQTMARVADWQTTVLADYVLGDASSPEDPDELMSSAAELVPVIEELQSYVWRRHLVAAAGRLLPVASDAPDSGTQVVGFADIVGFTSLSRSLSEQELESLVEEFEARTASVIAERRGRVVKTIGDEVLFVVADPADAAEIALDLMAWVQEDEDIPRLRIGMAQGHVITRLGDVYGPVVNVASRLTSVARPGTCVVDRDLASSLEDRDDVHLKRLRRVSVRGYSKLEPWVLRPGKGSRDDDAQGDKAP